MSCNPEPLVLQKRQRVRSAWISFAGRIAAQLIGAVATVGLGVVVLGHRTGDVAPVVPTVSAASTAPSVLVATPIRTQQGTVIVLVPLDRYNDVTADTVETVSHVLAANWSQMADALAVGADPADTSARGQTLSTPRWAAAKAH